MLTTEQQEQVERLVEVAADVDPLELEAFIVQAAGGELPVVLAVRQRLGLAELAPDETGPTLRPDGAPPSSTPTDTVIPMPSDGARIAPDETGQTIPASKPKALAEPSEQAARAGVPSAGETVGSYKLLERIGEGGFGLVYKAKQSEPIKRIVAIKVLMTVRPDVVARFEAERQALAKMNHPGIAKIFDGGVTDRGFPYLVMEYVKGDPVIAFCDRERLGIPERLELFTSICDAIEHAHRKQVLHRDIKPGNILAGYTDDEQAGGKKIICKVIDFGIAKALDGELTDKTIYTSLGDQIGTPDYMSPEQAEMGNTDIDTLSDVYSLGVLLYELLVGARPFSLRERAQAEMLRVIREEDPPKPATRLSSLGDGITRVAQARKLDTNALTKVVRGELEWITLRALKKDRAERYGSASDFGRDIRRHLEGEAVAAGPDSAWYRLKKFARRHRVAVIGTASALTLVLAGFVGTSYGLVQAERQRQRAVSAAEDEQIARVAAQESAEIARSQEQLADRRRREAEIAQELSLEARDRERAAREVAEAVGTFLNEEVLGLAAPDEEGVERRGRDLTVREALERAAASLDERPDGELSAEVERALHGTIGSAMLRIGQPERAEPHLERAIAMEDAGDALSPSERAITRLELAEALFRQNRGEEAASLSAQAVELARAASESDDDIVADALRQHAGSLKWAGEIDAAIDLYRQLESLSALQGGPELASDRYNLALALTQRGAEGDPERGRELMEQAYADRVSLLGKRHVETQNAAAELAKMLRPIDPTRAETLYREALEGMRATRTDEHWRTRQTLVNLGRLMYYERQYEEAARVLDEAVALYRRWSGPTHPHTLTVTGYLAEVHVARGDPAEAVAEIERAWAAADASDEQARETARVVLQNLGDNIGVTLRLD